MATEFIPENWVIFQLGETKTLRFYDHAKVKRTIVDPITKREKYVETLVFYVNRENGIEVSKMFSVLSTKLASELAAYIPDKAYLRYEFRIQKPLEKYSPPHLVEVRPIIV